LDNHFCVETFYLPKESNHFFSSAPLFNFFQNPVVHWVALITLQTLKILLVISVEVSIGKLLMLVNVGTILLVN
jgi:hypothetical protein